MQHVLGENLKTDFMACSHSRFINGTILLQHWRTLKLHDWTLQDWTLTDWTTTDECVGS